MVSQISSSPKPDSAEWWSDVAQGLGVCIHDIRGEVASVVAGINQCLSVGSALFNEDEFFSLRPELEQWRDVLKRTLGATTDANAVDPVPERGTEGLRAPEALSSLDVAPPPSAEGWHPIETAPKDGTRVLVWDSYDEHTVVAWGWGKWFLSVPGAYAESTDHTFTHWRPLPQAPGAVSAEDCAVDRVVETGQEGTTRDKSLSSSNLPLPAAPVTPEDETGVD